MRSPPRRPPPEHPLRQPKSRRSQISADTTVDAAVYAAKTAGFIRRLFSLAYETLLLAAVLIAGAFPFLFLMQHIDAIAARPLLQLYLLVLCGGYFSWQWCHSGQTLPMKSWRLKLVTRDGMPLTARHAVYRFLFALLGLALFGAGFLWAIIDRDRQFLHDRLAGTRIVNDK